MAGAEVVRVLGLDPGSRITGYGVIEGRGATARYLASGCIKLDEHAAFAQRLKVLYENVAELISRHQPQVVAVEQVFVSKNAGSALKLGQARGVLLCAGALAGLQVTEYTPADIKRTIVGGGRAEKTQVQHMVKVLLKLNGALAADAADALAVALCHLRYAQAPLLRRTRR